MELRQRRQDDVASISDDGVVYKFRNSSNVLTFYPLMLAHIAQDTQERPAMAYEMTVAPLRHAARSHVIGDARMMCGCLSWDDTRE